MTFKGKTAEQRMSLRGATKARRGNPCSKCRHEGFAETLLNQQTALIEQGLDLDSQYQLSHAEQAQFAAETANNAISNQAVGELARLMKENKDSATFIVQNKGLRGINKKTVGNAGETGIISSGAVNGAYNNNNDPKGSNKI